MSEIEFEAVISITGVNPFVRPPEEVLKSIFEQAQKKTSPIPIKGHLNEAAFAQSLVRYQGDWKLYINMKMAKAAELSFSKNFAEIVGRKVQISIAFDPQPRLFEMLPSLQSELDKNPLLSQAWKRLTPSLQKEVLRYLHNLKSDKKKVENIEKVLAVLSGQEMKFLGRQWNTSQKVS